MRSAEPTYVSGRGLSIAIAVLVMLQIALLVLATTAWALATIAVGGDVTGVIAAFGSATLLDVVAALLFVAATVVFLTWVHRAVANLPALGSTRARFSPADAVWSFFVPGLNLVRGHQVMATIWQESQPPVGDAPRRANLVHGWWTMGLVYLFTLAVHAMASSSRVGVEELHAISARQIVLHLLRIATAVPFLLVVRGAQSRQDEQWLDVERRRNVPQPTADALR